MGRFSDLILGVKIKVTGDRIPRNRPCLFIMNHRCHLDWLFCFMYFQRYGNIYKTKVILKYPLKHIPGIGWATQFLRFIFVKRNWEQDKQHMDKILTYFNSTNSQLQILLFPEGTDITESALIKSNSFASKNGLQPLKHCLHPRMTGFTFVVEKLREEIDSIHDISIGYPTNQWYGEVDLFRGTLPREIHFHVQKHSIRDIPRDSKRLEQWCLERWHEKDKRLEAFYKDGYFEQKEHARVSNDSTKSMIFWLLFWIFSVFTGCYLIFNYSLVRWYFIGMFIFIFFISCFIGIDNWFLKLHAKEANNNQ